MILLALSLDALLESSTLRVVALGSALLGVVSGALGAFAVLRKQSLLGDAISHAALPGLVLAFLLLRWAAGVLPGDPDAWRAASRSPLALVLGAAAAGWVATLLVTAIVRSSRVPFDSALGGVLAVFFGTGLVLLTYSQKNVPGSAQVGLERYLFGQAATILQADLWAIGGLGALALAALAAFWKEFKLVSFDPEFAGSLGLPVRGLDVLLTTLLVLAIVVGLQCVGVVLMSAMVVAPGAAARQWTDRLGRMVLLSASFGALSGVAGTFLSDALSEPGRGVPTGPTIVLCATALVVISLLFAPRRGLVWRRGAT
jgi:manganese/zinc/iron transport system permease protein